MDGCSFNYEYALKDILKILNILLENVSLPCLEINNIVETFKRIFFLKYENNFEIPKL